VDEAYPWALTVAITSTAAGSAVAGAVIDSAGDARWAFVSAGAVTLAGALVAGRPGGALARADRLVAQRLRAASALARVLPALRPPPAERWLPGRPDDATAALTRPGRMPDSGSGEQRATRLA
jgi:hypothetical protein